MPADYVLPLSDGEIARYRLMAEMARGGEADLWTGAGIVPGATVADVGCGPAATGVAMAQVVTPGGRVIGVERDPTALEHARQLVAAAGVDNLELREGDASATGLDAASVDVAVMRHVLAHNGGREQEIVDHLATLVRPGGTVYLVDVDLSVQRMWPTEPPLDALVQKYAAFHASLGNNPAVGLRLGELLENAGLTDVAHHARWNTFPAPVGLRPPSWVARDAMLAAGFLTPEETAECEAAFERLDSLERRPTLFIGQWIGVARRSPG
jgi:ubiquinone/menaquinone biosynthesis C-methylase UbiE